MKNNPRFRRVKSALAKRSAQFVAGLLVIILVSPAGHGQGMGMGDMGMDMGMGGFMRPSPLQAATDALRAAKSDAQRQKAIATIKSELARQYDQFLNQNDQQLQQMEARLERLRTQLKRREKAKDQMVDLELQRVVNEADGLVWPQKQDQFGGMGMGGSGMGMGRSGGGMGFGGVVFNEFELGSALEVRVPLQPAENVKANVKSLSSDEMNDQDRLRTIALACLNHESAYQQFPSNITGKDGMPLLSWRVAILPMLGRADLYNQFKLDEPWDSAHNIKLLDKMPEPKTRLLGVDGPETIFESGEVQTFEKMTDGSSNTILCLLASEDAAIEWTRPADLSFTPGQKLDGLAVDAKGRYQFVTCDGAAHSIDLESLPPQKLQLLLQRNDGMVAPDLNSLK